MTKTNKYVYDKEKEKVVLESKEGFIDKVEVFEEEDVEYYWYDMSYFRIPEKTNHFEYYEEGEDFYENKFDSDE